MPTSRAESASRLLAATSLAIATWVLVLSAAYYTQPFFGRAATPPQAGLAEIERLACIEAAIERATVPGEDIRLVIENGDEYLRQRVTELMYPRIGLVADPAARTVSVSLTPTPSEGADVCNDVTISVESRG